MTEEKTEYWNNYIDHLIDLMDGIQLHKVTVLTGRNGGGKSMMRKLIKQFMKHKPELQNLEYGKDWIISSVSMDDRAGVNPNKMMVFTRDCEWCPTSENTFDLVDGLLDSKDSPSRKYYLVLDELEIGMGEELQAGLAQYLNEKLVKMDNENCLGILIITHSRTLVKGLNFDDFINLEGMTSDEWVNREVVPMLPSELKEKSGELYAAFQKRLKPAV